MKKIASAILLGTMLCGAAMATEVDLSNTNPYEAINGTSLNGFTFNYGFYNMLDGTNIGSNASISYDAGSFNLNSMKINIMPFYMGGSGQIGFDFTPFQLKLEYKDIGGHLLGSQEVTISQFSRNHVLNATNVHEVIFSTVGDHGPRLESFNISPVPEPETYGMMLAGLGLVGFMARRKRTNAAA